MEQVLERPRGKAGENSDQPKVMHRKGSLKGRVVNPENLKERLIARRQELNLSQGDVAKQIEFWNNKAQLRKVLSRSAYCMYESGEVTPDLGKIVTLAKVLKCSPEWLAFGIGESDTTNDNLVEEVEWDAKTAEFSPRKTWTIDPEWAETRFSATPADLALATVNDFSPSLKPGDLAVVRRDVEPKSGGGEFVFVQDDEMKVAHLTRPTAEGPYRVYETDRKNYSEVPQDDLTFLGKVVGRMGDI